MSSIFENIPWDRLSETSILTVIFLIVFYYIFIRSLKTKVKLSKIELDKNKDDNEKEITLLKQKTSIELQKIKQEVSQIKNNEISKGSTVEISEQSQFEDNKISNSTFKVVK